MIQRLRFDISTDTGGDFTQLSGPCEGMIMQLRVDTGVFDTGCDFLVEAVNPNGSAMPIAHYQNSGGSTWTRVPRIGAFDTGGTEIGAEYPVVAHDRLRLTVTQSDGVAGSLTGIFWVWVGS